MRLEGTIRPPVLTLDPQLTRVAAVARANRVKAPVQVEMPTVATVREGRVKAPALVETARAVAVALGLELALDEAMD